MSPITACEMCSGVATKPAGVRFAIAASCAAAVSSPKGWRNQRDETRPGLTAFTRTSGASATASQWVRWVSAALETPYGGEDPLARSPATEATLTMQPRAFFRCGAAAREAYQGPIRLTPR